MYGASHIYGVGTRRSDPCFLRSLGHYAFQIVPAVLSVGAGCRREGDSCIGTMVSIYTFPRVVSWALIPYYSTGGSSKFSRSTFMTPYWPYYQTKRLTTKTIRVLALYLNPLLWSPYLYASSPTLLFSPILISSVPIASIHSSSIYIHRFGLAWRRRSRTTRTPQYMWICFPHDFLLVLFSEDPLQR